MSARLQTLDGLNAALDGAEARVAELEALVVDLQDHNEKNAVAFDDLSSGYLARAEQAEARVAELGAIVDGLRESEARSRAERQAILDACGASADVDEGRDPVEAARAVRANAANWSDQWLTEHTRRLELERAYATFAIETNDLGAEVGFEPPGVTDQAVGGLLLQWGGHTIGTCDRCGKRAPLDPSKGRVVTRDDGWFGVSQGTCAWGCEVKP